MVQIDKQVKARCDKGLHQPMLTREEYDTLTAIVSGRKRNKYERKTHNPDFPLSKTPCRECGGKLVGFTHTNGKGWSRPKYRCRGCGKQYQQSKIHDALDKVLDMFELKNDSQHELLAALAEVWQERNQDNVRHIVNLEAELEKLNTTRHHLTIDLFPTRAVRLILRPP